MKWLTDYFSHLASFVFSFRKKSFSVSNVIVVYTPSIVFMRKIFWQMIDYCFILAKISSRKNKLRLSLFSLGYGLHGIRVYVWISSHSLSLSLSNSISECWKRLLPDCLWRIFSTIPWSLEMQGIGAWSSLIYRFTKAEKSELQILKFEPF